MCNVIHEVEDGQIINPAILGGEVQSLPAGQNPQQWLEDINNRIAKLEVYMRHITPDNFRAIKSSEIRLSVLLDGVMDDAKESV